MVKHLIHTAVTRKIYLDIWRNIKICQVSLTPIVFYRKYNLPQIDARYVCNRLGEGAYYYFIREDKCIPYYRNFIKINQLY